MTITKVTKTRGNKIKWKCVSSTNNYTELQQNKIGARKHRVVLKNETRVVDGFKKGQNWLLAEDADESVIQKEFTLINKILVPILEKFSTQEMVIKFSELEAVMDGIGVQKKIEEKKETEKLTRESQKVLKKETRKPKKNQSRKRPKKNIYSSDSDFDILPSDPSDDSSDEEDLDEHDTTDVDDEFMEQIKKNGIKEKLRIYRTQYQLVKNIISRYKRMGNNGAKMSPRDIENCDASAKRLKPLTAHLNKHFFEKGKRRRSEQEKNIMDQYNRAFREMKNVVTPLLKSKELRAIRLLKKTNDMSGSSISSRIKKSHVKRKKGKKRRRYDVNGRVISDDEDSDEGMVQAQRQQTQRVLRLSDAQAIDAELAIAQETQRDLLEMQTEFNEVTDMMKDMQGLVHSQQDIIDDMEDKVENTIEHVDKGRKNIREARKHQKFGLGRLMIKGGLGFL